MAEDIDNGVGLQCGWLRKRCGSCLGGFLRMKIVQVIGGGFGLTRVDVEKGCKDKAADKSYTKRKGLHMVPGRCEGRIVAEKTRCSRRNADKATGKLTKTECQKVRNVRTKTCGSLMASWKASRKRRTSQHKGQFDARLRIDFSKLTKRFLKCTARPLRALRVSRARRSPGC